MSLVLACQANAPKTLCRMKKSKKCMYKLYTLSHFQTHQTRTHKMSCICNCCIGRGCTDRTIAGSFPAPSLKDCTPPLCTSHFPVACRRDAYIGGSIQATWLQKVPVDRKPIPVDHHHNDGQGGVFTFLLLLLLFVCVCLPYWKSNNEESDIERQEAERRQNERAAREDSNATVRPPPYNPNYAVYPAVPPSKSSYSTFPSNNAGSSSANVATGAAAGFVGGALAGGIFNGGPSRHSDGHHHHHAPVHQPHFDQPTYESPTQEWSTVAASTTDDF